MSIELEKYMHVAIEEAKMSLCEGNNGFGSVIVYKNEIIAKDHDREETDADPTSHAEMNAIRKASKILGKDLNLCTIVSTHEPCPMCTSAIVWANIGTVVYGYSIEEAIKQGRRRIDVRCRELFLRSNRNVKIVENILFEDCSLLYNRDVRNEIKKLYQCTDSALKEYNDLTTKKRIEWFRNHTETDENQGCDSKEKAYRLFLKKLNIAECEAPIIEKTSDRIVFHSVNFCPTLEACKILNLDTRHICQLYNEKSTDAFIKQINPNLKFCRNYEKLRPYSDYCEEMIIDERT